MPNPNRLRYLFNNLYSESFSEIEYAITELIRIGPKIVDFIEAFDDRPGFQIYTVTDQDAANRIQLARDELEGA